MSHLYTILIFVAAGVLTTGCEKKDAKSILETKTYYYAEPCEFKVHYTNHFGSAAMIEEEYHSGNREGSISIPISYRGNMFLVKDGQKSFPCIVDEKREYVSIECEYEEKREAQKLWISLELANKHLPECKNSTPL